MRDMYAIITNYTKTAAVIGLMLLLASCADDGIIEETPRIITPEPQEIVDATLYGRVISANGHGIDNAEVSYLSGLNPALTTTDAEGYFLLKDVRNKGTSAFISVRSGDNFEAFRRYSVSPGKYNYTEIKMAGRTIIGSVESDQGGTLTKSDGAKITLPSDGIISKNGDIYQGQVDVAMNWIDPTSELLSAEMVGDLSGINEAGERKSLTTYGMLQVELIGSSGQLLNLREGYEADLTFPIPSELASLATPSIPLWSYDEIIGTWVQEGFAIKEGNVYVGQVSHFSSWNVDHMTDPIEIKGIVKFQLSEEVNTGAGYLQIKVCSDNIGTKGGWLCEDGTFRFYNFPKDEEFKIKVYDHCGNKLYQETYGPYQSDTEIEAIIVENSNNIIQLTGNAITCEEMVVSNGQLSVRLEDRYLNFPVNDNGEFEFAVDVCNDEPVEITIVDLDALLEKTFAVEPTEEIIELIDLKVCDQLEEYIIVKLDTFKENVLTTNFEILPDSIGAAILYEKENDSIFEYFTLFIPSVGVLPTSTTALLFEYSSGNNRCSNRGEAPNIKVELTAYGENDGDLIEGSYAGTIICNYNTNTGDTLSVSGSFRIIR